MPITADRERWTVDEARITSVRRERRVSGKRLRSLNEAQAAKDAEVGVAPV